MTLHRPYPSIGDYIETIANPSGRFATLRDLLPVTDPTGLPVYVCGTGRVTFRVTLNNHAHDLTCFTTPAALRNAHRYGQLLPDEAYVFNEDSAGAFYPVVLRAVETPTDTNSSSIEPEDTPATEDSSTDVPVSDEPDSAGELYEGLRVVVRGDFFGYADTEGHLVIEPQYVWAGDFGEGRAAVAVAAPGDEQGTLMGLIDREGFSQEECAGYMHVARTTAQQIYNRARRKIAEALVSGLNLRIEGGDYALCDGKETECGCGGCRRHRRAMRRKENHTMRIAVTYEDGQIFQHFGHTESFKIYDEENGAVREEKVVSTNGQGHGALASVLKDLGADVLICGGIGGGAQAALKEAGIRLYAGVSGSCDEAVKQLLDGSLAYVQDATCDHHSGHHHGDHACGDHGCKEHSCH